MPHSEAAGQTAAFRHHREPPHRLDRDSVVERRKAIRSDENVPVVRNSSGRWIVEKYYCDQVMAPKLSSSD